MTSHLLMKRAKTRSIEAEAQATPGEGGVCGLSEIPSAERALSTFGLVVRPATEADASAIRTAVKSERLNPTGLDWRRFLVVEQAGTLAACAQMRFHADGARELGSLLVRPAWRGRGIAARLIAAHLDREAGPVYMITGRAHAPHYAKSGFEPVPLRTAPWSVGRNFVIGSLAGIISMLTGRRRKPMVILRREARRAVRADREVHR